MPTFIKQIERAFKEYPEGKLDDLCGMKMRVCVAIVENQGDNYFRSPHRKKCQLCLSWQPREITANPQGEDGN